MLKRCWVHEDLEQQVLLRILRSAGGFLTAFGRTKGGERSPDDKAPGNRWWGTYCVVLIPDYHSPSVPVGASNRLYFPSLLGSSSVIAR